MTPSKDNYEVSIDRMTEVVRGLRALEIPAQRVHSIAVNHWSLGTVVNIQISGATTETVALVDRIADHYGLPGDDGKTSNYARGAYLGESTVHVFCGRPETEES